MVIKPTLPPTQFLAPFPPSRPPIKVDISRHWGPHKLWGNASLVSPAVTHRVWTWHDVGPHDRGTGPVTPWIPFPRDSEASSLCSLWPREHLEQVQAQSTDSVASDMSHVSKLPLGRRPLCYEPQAQGWVRQVSSLTERVATGFEKLVSYFGWVISCCVQLNKFLKLLRFSFLMYQLNSFSFTCLLELQKNVENHVGRPGTGT